MGTRASGSSKRSGTPPDSCSYYQSISLDSDREQWVSLLSYGSPQWTRFELLRPKTRSARTTLIAFGPVRSEQNRRSHPAWAPSRDGIRTKRDENKHLRTDKPSSGSGTVKRGLAGGPRLGIGCGAKRRELMLSVTHPDDAQAY